MKTCDELESDFLSSFQQLRTLVHACDSDILCWIMKAHIDIIKQAKAITLTYEDDFNFVLGEAMHHSLFKNDPKYSKKMEALYKELGTIHSAMEQACESRGDY